MHEGWVILGSVINVCLIWNAMIVWTVQCMQTAFYFYLYIFFSDQLLFSMNQPDS